MLSGLGVALPIKTRVLIFLNDGKKLFNCSHLGNGIIAVPFEICPSPEDPPNRLSSNEGCLCDGAFNLLARIVPHRPNLEDFNAVALDTDAEVDLATNMRWWSILLDEQT